MLLTLVFTFSKWMPTNLPGGRAVTKSKQAKEELNYHKAVVSSDEDRTSIVRRQAKGKGPEGRSPFLRCSVAVLAVGLALVLQLLLVPWFGIDPDSSPFFGVDPDSSPFIM